MDRKESRLFTILSKDLEIVLEINLISLNFLMVNFPQKYVLQRIFTTESII